MEKLELLIQAKYSNLGSEKTQTKVLGEGFDDEKCRRGLKKSFKNH